MFLQLKQLPSPYIHNNNFTLTTNSRMLQHSPSSCNAYTSWHQDSIRSIILIELLLIPQAFKNILTNCHLIFIYQFLKQFLSRSSAKSAKSGLTQTQLWSSGFQIGFRVLLQDTVILVVNWVSLASYTGVAWVRWIDSNNRYKHWPVFWIPISLILFLTVFFQGVSYCKSFHLKHLQFKFRFLPKFKVKAKH